MKETILFHTYWDFRIESIAWKTHTEIFSSNHNRESTFSHVGKGVSSNQKSAVRMNQSVRKRVHVAFWRLFNLHSQKFTELLKFSRKFTINHRQSSNRFSTLDKPIKKYIQLEDQSKKTRTKTRWDARLACLANLSTEGRGKKSFKQGKYAVSLLRRQRVLPSKEMSESSKHTT